MSNFLGRNREWLRGNMAGLQEPLRWAGDGKRDSEAHTVEAYSATPRPCINPINHIPE